MSQELAKEVNRLASENTRLLNLFANARSSEYRGELSKRLDHLEAENAALKAELEELRPKPVVKVTTHYVDHHESYPEFVDADAIDEVNNLKLTFENGVLKKAEVI